MLLGFQDLVCVKVSARETPSFRRGTPALAKLLSAPAKGNWSRSGSFCRAVHEAEDCCRAGHYAGIRLRQMSTVPTRAARSSQRTLKEKYERDWRGSGWPSGRKWKAGRDIHIRVAGRCVRHELECEGPPPRFCCRLCSSTCCFMVPSGKCERCYKFDRSELTSGSLHSSVPPAWITDEPQSAGVC